MTTEEINDRLESIERELKGISDAIQLVKYKLMDEERFNNEVSFKIKINELIINKN
jgi:hypothetical protein